MCLFLGSHTTLSVTVLRTLLDAGLSVAAMVVPRGTRSRARVEDVIPLYRPDNLESVCDVAGVPIVEVGGAPTLDLLEDLAGKRPDHLVCVCFPARLPESVLRFPRDGCLNLHPSLLPAYRGPAPVFWQLRAGESAGGVTLHHMNEMLDAGDIVAQTAFEIPLGVSARELDKRAGTAGAALIMQVIGEPKAKSWPQDEGDASYFSWPQAKDFVIDRSWPAERVFRFMRGTWEMGRFYSIDIEGDRFVLESALMYSAGEVLGRAYERFGADMRIQFAPGVVHVVVA